MLPSQTAGKKTTFPCLLCSRRASCNGENRRLLFRGGPFRFTDRTGPRFWPQFRSDVQIRALMPASTISREVRFTCVPLFVRCASRAFRFLCGARGACTCGARAFHLRSRLSGIVLRILLSPSISFFGLCRRRCRIFDGVLPFTDGTNLCQYICYRGHLSRGGGQIRGTIHRQTEQSSRFSGRRGFPGGSDPEKQPGSLMILRGEEGLRAGQTPKSSQEA